MPTSAKCRPISDIYNSWLVVPSGAAYAAIDETEDDLNLTDYINSAYPDGIFRLGLQKPSLARITITEMRAIIHARDTAGPSAYLDIAVELGGWTWEYFNVSLTSSWQWFALTLPLIAGAPPVDIGASFPDWSVTGNAGVYTSAQIAAAYVQFDYQGGTRIAETPNPFDQRFRAFDDAAAGAISFERRDLAAGSWATKTNPFPAGSSQPTLQYLRDGRLHASFVDSAGALQHRLSYNDGDTWVTP